jgi:hypothetical protein
MELRNFDDRLDGALRPDWEKAVDAAEHWPIPGDDDGFGYGNFTRDKKVEEAKPPVDEKGNELTREDIEAGLSAVRQAMLDVDKDAQATANGAEQIANRAKNLMRKYEKREADLKRWGRELDRWEKAEDTRLGFASYGMETDEGDEAIHELVTEEAERFHDEVDALKDQLADRVRARLDEMGEEANSVDVRDRIYDELVKSEVIEAWEPLEF